MEEYCKNCGAAITDNSKFCHDCGSRIKKDDGKNFCPNCGGLLSEGEDFCSECGENLNPQSENNAISEIKSNRTLLAIIAIVVILLAVSTVMISGVFNHPETPLEREDFGVFTMLVPVGSNYVETSSLPDYGYNIGGYVFMENAGDYSKEVFSIGISTIQAKSHPSEVSLYEQIGDITVYKDNTGHDAYYIERNVGDYEVTLIGNDEDAMIKMLNSIEITD